MKQLWELVKKFCVATYHFGYDACKKIRADKTIDDKNDTTCCIVGVCTVVVLALALICAVDVALLALFAVWGFLERIPILSIVFVAIRWVVTAVLILLLLAGATYCLTVPFRLMVKFAPTPSTNKSNAKKGAQRGTKKGTQEYVPQKEQEEDDPYDPITGWLAPEADHEFGVYNRDFSGYR